MPIVSVRHTSRCAILNTFDWMTVDSADSADIQYLSLSAREVLRRQLWWQWRSFWQFIWSRTILLKEWPGYIYYLFRVRNVSHGGLPSPPTLVSVWNTRVFRTALTALVEPRTLWRRIRRDPSPKRWVALHTSLAAAMISCLVFLRRVALYIPLPAPASGFL